MYKEDDGKTSRNLSRINKQYTLNYFESTNMQPLHEKQGNVQVRTQKGSSFTSSTKGPLLPGSIWQGTPWS